MKTRRGRFGRWVRWGIAVGFGLSLIAMVVSRWGWLQWRGPKAWTTTVYTMPGAIGIRRGTYFPYGQMDGLHVGALEAPDVAKMNPDQYWQWWPTYDGPPEGSWKHAYVRVPFWVGMVVSAGAWAGLRWRDARKRRRVEAGFCGGCGYEKGVGVVGCPECGVEV